MRVLIFFGLLALLTAGCGALVSTPLPTGWQRYTVNDLPLSIAAPPGWFQLEPSEDTDADELLFLGITDPDGFLKISRVDGAPTTGDDWLSWYEGETGLPLDLIHDEWLQLPAGRASHGTSKLGDFYLFLGPDGSVLTLHFFDTQFHNEENVDRNRAVAATFRFDSER